MREMPIRKPGIIPPRNNFATEAFAITEYIITDVLGGIMGPIAEDAKVIALENSGSYPFFVIPSISMVPKAPRSATALPDIPAKIILAKTFTWPNPPRIQPTLILAKLNIRCVIPAEFINLPARVNKGNAIKINDVITPVHIYTGTALNGTSLIIKYGIDAKIRDAQIGTLRMKRIAIKIITVARLKLMVYLSRS
jgi:hypothetical protein